MVVGAASSGLYGSVVLDPARPVCQAGQPCTAPAKWISLAFARHGVVAHTRTDDRGAFRIGLQPGAYTVTSPHKLGRGIEPRRVVVPSGRLRRVDLTLDFGIR
jgi:hypothetical protein